MDQTALQMGCAPKVPDRTRKNDSYTDPYRGTTEPFFLYRTLMLLCSLVGLLTVSPIFPQGKEQEFKLGDPLIGSFGPIARLTGATVKGDTLPNPNAGGTRYNVGGTDLGIFWEMADGTLGCFFGDTNGNDFKPSKKGGGNGGAWRSNVLAFSRDHNLEDGLTFSSWATDSRGRAREIIPSAHDTSGTGDWTSIPTAAISVLGTEYVHYMNVRDWGKAGDWDTNYSSIYHSDDLGRTWAPMEGIAFPADSGFAQVAFAKKDGYVYMMGTQSGRLGPAYLARALEADFPKLAKFEYLGPEGKWRAGDESFAIPVLSAPVGELSLIYHPGFKRWVVLYLNHNKIEIVMRTAERPEGPWSEEQTLADNREYRMLYGSFIHPASIKGNALYFSMSIWHPYNVFLMKATLEAAN